MQKRRWLFFAIISVTAILMNLTMACNLFQSSKGENKKDAQDLARLQVLFKNRKSAQALPLFKSLEPRLTKGIGLYKSWLFFALYGTNANTRSEYGKKFLNEKDLTKDLAMRKGEVYRSFARDARAAGDLTKTRELLEEGILVSRDMTLKQILVAELAQLDLLGQPAPWVTANTWFNKSESGLLSQGFNGNPTILAFRAPWCEKSMQLTGLLKNTFATFEGKGVLVVDVMKLYGYYKDAGTNKENLPAAEETTLIGQSVKRQGIDYPVAVANEGLPFEAYKVSVLPTLFFIDKQGNIIDMEIGSGSPEAIREKIKNLLEEK